MTAEKMGVRSKIKQWYCPLVITPHELFVLLVHNGISIEDEDDYLCFFKLGMKSNERIIGTLILTS